MKIGDYFTWQNKRDRSFSQQPSQGPMTTIPQKSRRGVTPSVTASNLLYSSGDWAQRWNFSFESLSNDSIRVAKFLSSCTLEELLAEHTQEVSMNGGVVTETVRSLILVDLRATIITAGWLVTLSKTECDLIERDSCIWRDVSGQGNVRAILSYCYYKPDDMWLSLSFVVLARGLGYQINRQSNPPNKSRQEIESQSTYDGEMNNMGFFARDGGAFGSLCLHDNYGDEASGQERRFYDD